MAQVLYSFVYGQHAHFLWMVDGEEKLNLEMLIK